MTVDYFLAFLFSFAVSVAVALIVRRIAVRYNVVDDPKSAPQRKRHTSPIPLLGGWAIFISIGVSLLVSTLFTPVLFDYFLSVRQLFGILLGAAILVIGGTLDDKYGLPPKRQILFPFFASIAVVICGLGISFITNPFGGVIQLDTIQIPVIEWSGIVYSLTLFSDVFTIVWLMVLMYATKFLDGLDGLAAGVGGIGAVLLFLFSISDGVNQPGTGLFAVIVAGACLGFLLLNRHPAKIFLGEGGSVLIGFFLGVLAIISGAKIATALLILAFPLLDVLWVIFSRVQRGEKIWHADRAHLHFRLQDRGLSTQQVVYLFYGLSILFGLSSLFVHTKLKLIFLVVAALLSLALVWFALHKPSAKNA